MSLLHAITATDFLARMFGRDVAHLALSRMCLAMFLDPARVALHHGRYIIPGGSAGRYERQGYTFDVGSSMMFGMGQEGTTNLITRALAAVGRSIDSIPDPTQIHYRLPRSAAHPLVRACLACCACAMLLRIRRKADVRHCSCRVLAAGLCAQTT